MLFRGIPTFLIVGALLGGWTAVASDQDDMRAENTTAVNMEAFDTQFPGPLTLQLEREWGGLPKGSFLIGKLDKQFVTENVLHCAKILSSVNAQDNYEFQGCRHQAVAAFCIVKVVAPDGWNKNADDNVCLGRALAMPGQYVSVRTADSSVYFPKSNPFFLYTPPAPVK